MFGLTAGTIFAILGIAFAVLAAIFNLLKELYDGKGGLAEELHINEPKRKERKKYIDQVVKVRTKDGNIRSFKVRKRK